MNSGSLVSVNQKLGINKLKIANERQQIVIVEKMLSLFNNSLNNQIKAFNNVTDINNKTANEMNLPDIKSNLDEVEKINRKRKNSDVIVESCHINVEPPYMIPQKINPDNINVEPPYTIPQKINPVNINFIPYALPLKSGINMGKGKYEGRGPRMNVPNYPPMVNNMSLGRGQIVCQKVPKSRTKKFQSTSMVNNLNAWRYPDKCEQVNVPNVKGVIINHMLIRQCFVVSGSNGYLSKFSATTETIFETGNTDNIWHSEILITGTVLHIYAFTRLRVLIFIDKRPSVHAIMEFPAEYVDNIADVFVFKKKKVYITLKTGAVKCIDVDGWEFGDVFTPDVDCQFSVAVRSRFRLATIEDSLYKLMGRRTVRSKELIPGITGIKGITSSNKYLFFCYSDKQIWVIDEMCRTKKCIDFENRIKLVNVFLSDLVVVDETNTIHVYTMDKKNQYGKKRFEQSMGGLITSIDLRQDKVGMVMDNGVYTYPLR